MFIDGAEEATIGQYANYGPNNEVYLAQGQAISFKLTGNTNEIASIQIGAKAPNGAATMVVEGKVSTTTRLEQQLNTATEMYYNITEQAKDGQLVTISNTGNGILSLTNLKITYKTSGQTVTLSDLTAEEQANAVAMVQAQFAAPVEKVYGAIKSLGFLEVVEVAQGAMETTRHEAEELKEKLAEGQPFMTTSCCPSYIQLAEKHIPDLKKYISTTGSPMYYTARIVKEKYPDAKIVFVGPCVAKRKEVKMDPCVDFTLTFEEVGSVLAGMDIKIEEAQPFTVLRNSVREAHGFAQAGGVINAVKVYLKEDQDASLNTIQVANLTKKNVALLRAYAKTGKAPGQFIEVMACEGGCVTGPCVHGDRSAGQKQLLKELTKY